MKIQADRRSIEVTEDAGLLERLRGLAEERRELDLRIASALVDAERKRAYVAEEAASLPELCSRWGLDREDTWRLYRIGRAMEAFTPLEEKIRNGDVPLGNAAQIGRIATSPDLMRAGDRWLDLAEWGSRAAVRRAVVTRIEEVAQRETVVPLALRVKRTALERFRQVRDIASRKAGRRLTEGQTFDVANTFYLDRHDESRKATRKRRMGNTSGDPKKRGVPAEVRRELVVRSEGCCEVSECPNRVFVQRAHRTPNREGGGQEIHEQFLLCWIHHLLYDAGRLRFVGWTDDQRPVFQTWRGRVLRPRGARVRPARPRSDPSKSGDGPGRIADRRTAGRRGGPASRGWLTGPG